MFFLISYLQFPKLRIVFIFQKMSTMWQLGLSLLRREIVARRVLLHQSLYSRLTLSM